MADADDPYVSFGRCYFNDSGDEAPSRFIPCGNVNFGNVTCCQSDDMCLSSNACYNGQSGMTYIAGCTDESYEDDVCPPKDNYASDAWVGVTYCNGTSNEWVGCEDNRGSSTVTTTNPCWCPESSRTVAFSDASVLANVVSLGSATGESLDWQGGFLPNTDSSVSGGQPTGSGSDSSRSTPASTSAETTTQSTTVDGTPTVTTAVISTTVGSAAGSSSDSSGGGGGLSTGAKAGIGVGAGLGALLLAALLIWALIRVRKKKQQRGSSMPAEAEKEPGRTLEKGSAAPLDRAAPPQHGRYYDNQAAAPAVFGHKSELDAVDTAAMTPVTPSPRHDQFNNRPRSEVEGSPAQGSTEGRALKDGGWEMPGQMGTIYEKPS